MSDVAIKKKASLNRVVSKTQPEDAYPVDMREEADSTTPKPKVALTPFEPRKRDDTDAPPDGEKWEETQRRKKKEAAEAEFVEARMTDTEQLGLDAGRVATQVKTLRREVVRYEKNLASTRIRLAEAEALLTYRLDELRTAGL